MNYQELYNRALNLLARREHSQHELKQKLLMLDDNRDNVEQVLQTLQSKNLQSDERFIEQFIHAKAQKYGTRKLCENLKQKGVDKEIVNEFLPDYDSELQTAKQILNKKFRLPETGLSSELKQKCYRFLSYRGFSADIVRRAVKEWSIENE